MKVRNFTLSLFIICNSSPVLACNSPSLLQQVNTQSHTVLSSFILQQSMINRARKNEVEITFVDKIPKKPPLVNVLIDVTLHNPDNQPYWFIIPSTIEQSFNLENKGIHAVELFQLKGQGNVVVSRFLGSGRFQALLLPAGAKIKIKRLPIFLWEEENISSVQIEVVIANELKINGQSLEVWLDHNPISDANANVDAEKMTMLKNRNVENFAEVPVSIVEKKRLKLDVPFQ